MNFNKHFELAGKHAFLSASKHHWTNYDDHKLDAYFHTQMAAQEGSELHDLAATLIKKKIKLPPNPKTMNMYVNDAIGYRMSPEQVLCYSYNCFGTADAISFHDNFLRIHDLKTGITRTSMRQLEVYAAMFCLEYDEKPGLIDMELRIYKSDKVEVHIPEIDDIAHIMDRIVTFDKRLDNLRAEVG